MYASMTYDLMGETGCACTSQVNTKTLALQYREGLKLSQNRQFVDERIH